MKIIRLAVLFCSMLISFSAFTQTYWVASGSSIINNTPGGGVRISQDFTTLPPPNPVWPLFSYGSASHVSGTAPSVWGAYILSLNTKAGTLTEAVGATITTGNESSGNGTVTTAYAIRAKVQAGLGTVNTGYGLYIDNTAATNDYGVYQSGADDYNFFAGNVGIGIDAPQEKLHINGSIRGNDTGGALRISTPTGFVSIGSMNAGYSHFMTDRGKFYFGSPIFVEGGSLSGINGSNVNLQTDGVTRMTILNANGNVGIGTSTPGTFKLAVEGKIGAREVVVTTAAWADYVFDTTYDLRPLSEVESFIKMNKHLPEIPSAEEVKTNGHKLGEMDVLLLKKVEELTLYVIELEKKISALENSKKFK